MHHAIMPVLVFGLTASTSLAAQWVPPVPPPAPAQVAPRPAALPPPAPEPPIPQRLQAQQPAPTPRVSPAPPVPPPPPAAFMGRRLQAPGLLFAPPSGGSYLGVHLIEVSAERARELGMKDPYGVEIMSVQPGSPADDAGIRKGDVIIKYRGQRLEGQEQLVRLVRETPVGREVEIGIFRGGKEMTLNVEIGELKSAGPNVLFNCGEEPCEIRIPNIRIRQFDFDIPKPRMVTQSRLLGVELEPLEGQLADYFGVKEGVLVRSVESDSPASRAGLKTGDAVVEVAGRAVRDSGQIREAIRSMDPQKPIDIAVMRNRSRVSLKMEPQPNDTESTDRQGRRVGRGQRY